MGVDAQICAAIPRGTVTHEAVRELAARMREVFHPYEKIEHCLLLFQSSDEIVSYFGENRYPDLDIIVVRNSMRYYGPGYERGPWPVISALLRWMQINFPSAIIYYSGDTRELTEYTADVEKIIWDHFSGPNSMNYYR